MTADAPDAPNPKPARSNEVVEIITSIGGALLFVLALKVLVFLPYTIPSASMEPNLYEGDYIIVSTYSYGYSRHSIPLSPPLFSGRIFFHEPARGDVVVFKLPRDNKTDYIKRVIGLPGDQVQVKAGAVYVNGKPIRRTAKPAGTEDMGGGLIQPVQRFEETLANGRRYLTNSYGSNGEVENTGVYLVPQGEYFVMGDNRDNSLDSRFPKEVGVGFVPAENLVGRARFVLLSWHPGASLFKPWTWVTNARIGRFFHLLS